MSLAPFRSRAIKNIVNLHMPVVPLCGSATVCFNVCKTLIKVFLSKINNSLLCLLIQQNSISTSKRWSLTPVPVRWTPHVVLWCHAFHVSVLLGLVSHGHQLGVPGVVLHPFLLHWLQCLYNITNNQTWRKSGVLDEDEGFQIPTVCFPTKIHHIVWQTSPNV